MFEAEQTGDSSLEKILQYSNPKSIRSRLHSTDKQISRLAFFPRQSLLQLHNSKTMKLHKITIATLLTISTVAGLQSTAFANHRFDVLNQQNSIQAQASRSENPNTISPQIEQPQSDIPEAISGQMQQSQVSTTTQKDSEINVKDIQPEYCRYLFPSSGTVSLFEYSEGLYHCEHGS